MVSQIYALSCEWTFLSHYQLFLFSNYISLKSHFPQHFNSKVFIASVNWLFMRWTFSVCLYLCCSVRYFIFIVMFFYLHPIRRISMKQSSITKFTRLKIYIYLTEKFGTSLHMDDWIFVEIWISAKVIFGIWLRESCS